MNVKQVLKLLKDDGWYLVTTVGSHRQFKHPIKFGRREAEQRPTSRNIKKHYETGRTNMSKENYEYLVLFEKSKNEFGAFSPDLPGCVAVGETKAEYVKIAA